MSTGKVSVLVGVLLASVGASCWGTECRFFRVGCLEGEAPHNLAMTRDELGEVSLEFDTQDQRSYVIEATDSLSPSPAWTRVASITGDGERARWLTTQKWSRTFGGSDYDDAGWVRQTSDGGYILAGCTRSFGAGGSDAWLIKTDSLANEDWSRTFGGSDYDYAYSVRQTSDGGYILAGWTYSFGAGSCDAWLIKTDSAGNEEWSRTFGGSDYDGAKSVQQTSDGGYIVAGLTYSFGAGSGDAWLIKTDSVGNEKWSTTFGGSDWDWAWSVQQTSDGGYILAGRTYSFGAGSCDAWLIKTDSLGNEEWSRTFGGSDVEGAWSVHQTSDGGYILAGYTGSFGAGSSDAWLIKTDSLGNEEWSRTFGGSHFEHAYSVQQTSDRGYIMAGYTDSFGPGGFDAWLIKTDSLGNAPLPQ